MSVTTIQLSPNDHVQGNAQAPLRLLEYGDFQCPSCGNAYPIVKAVQEHFGSELLFAYRHFPLVAVHRLAQSAAETAEWAGSRERFWEMHDALFGNQHQLGAPLYYSRARALDLPVDELRSALAKGTWATRVRSDFAGGVRSGVNGTPTFFINGVRHDGESEFEALVRAIDEQRMLPQASHHGGDRATTRKRQHPSRTERRWAERLDRNPMRRRQPRPRASKLALAGDTSRVTCSHRESAASGRLRVPRLLVPFSLSLGGLASYLR